jgi:hypothetical protein
MVASAFSLPNKVLYHVTFRRNRNKVLAQGLKVGCERVWHNKFGVLLGDRTKIYLFSDWKVAVQWAFKMWWDMGRRRPIDILSIDGDYMELTEDPNPWAGVSPGTWWMTGDPVAPDHVVAVTPLTEQLIKTELSRKPKSKA